MLKTENSSIKGVYLHRNPQVDDKCMKSIGEYIKYNKYVEQIRIKFCTISDTGIEILAPYLDDNITLKHFSFEGNEGVTDKSVPMLLKMIESSHLEALDINETSITQNHDITLLLSFNRIKYGSDSLHLTESLVLAFFYKSLLNAKELARWGLIIMNVGASLTTA